MARVFILLLVVSHWSLVTSPVFGQVRADHPDNKVQMVFEHDVAPDLKASLMVVGDPTLKTEAQAAFQKACRHAREILDRLDPLDPSSEIFQLLNQKTKGTFFISPDLAKILLITQQVAVKLKEPLAKQISLNLDKNEVTLKSADVLINIDPLLKGYLADVMIEDLVQAGWQDSFLDLKDIYVVRGQDFNGVWKIPVVDNTTSSAHHAFYFKAFNNIAAATVNRESKNLNTPSDLKSVTVFTEEGACKAQGLATAAFAAGLTNAKKILKVAGATRSVLIDQNGKFMQIPEENKKGQ